MLHTVFFWLDPHLSDEHRALFVAELKRVTQIPYLASASMGVPAKTAARPVVDHSYDYGLQIRFTSHNDHDYYQAECPDHARFVSTCKSMWTKVVIYDMEEV
jgi:hypothetical protein